MQSERQKGPVGKAVGGFVPQLVREALRRRGFTNIDVVLRWREIVGPALADQTWPLRIDWPRRQEEALRPDGTAAPGGQRTRLVVGAAPARALDVEYAKRDIVERVNRYLGYRAATEVTATPDYSVGPEVPRKPAATAAPQAGEHGSAVDPLKAALSKLGQGVARRGF
ncbi:MAG TPA: DciA family protein [Hyphomicrobiaceae bacterium]|jgi:hypothetical protein|nr:DciA family protein [Hyphomicrobiaceae bacterium]